MQFAVDLHYGAPDKTSHLDLIAADYYYARAISIASAVASVRAVDALARAIAEVSSAEASIAMREPGDGCDVPRKRAALFSAAGELGAFHAGLGEESIGVLSQFGRRCGVFFVRARGLVPERLCEGLPPLPAVARKAISDLERFDRADVTAGLEGYIDRLAGRG
ncbi:MAG: hypothetical protein ACYC1U_02690 [Candidatus Aquicultorales bacterium]